MTYRESYMMLKTQQDIINEAEKDIKIAMFMGNNPDRIEMIRLAAESVINERNDFVNCKLDSGEWVHAADVQQALGLSFAECMKQFEFSRTAEWWSVVGETEEEKARNGQKVTCYFKKKDVQRGERAMIYTTYFANLRKLPDNIIPISICGKAPAWYDGIQYKALAPKYDFFMRWKETHDNDYYIECFKKQVLNPLKAFEVINDLYRKIGIDLSEHGIDFNSEDGLDGEKHIALVCYEKPTDFCHRHLVAEWLNDNGFPCKEC